MTVVDTDAPPGRRAFHRLTVTRVIDETDDTRSFVLDVPAALADVYRYRPGQFCTFRVAFAADEHFRCYSMSSAPETDRDSVVTVKRVPGGLVSNWFNDRVSVGDRLDTSPPSGTFCLRDGDRPVLGFCGGSGITPVLSLVKSTLASTGRHVRLLYASRTPESVIFDGVLRGLEAGAGDRLDVRRHVDSVHGTPDPGIVRDVLDADGEADCYVCGPAPFMDLVETTLLGAGVSPDSILIERFGTPGPLPPGRTAGPVPDTPVPATVELSLRGRRHEVAYRAGDTVLETARRAGLAVPSSCEAGNCATCMALVREGSVTMRVNDALTPEEVEEGWVLTCQSVPSSPTLRIEYEDL